MSLAWDTESLTDEHAGGQRAGVNGPLSPCFLHALATRPRAKSLLLTVWTRASSTRSRWHSSASHSDKTHFLKVWAVVKA